LALSVDELAFLFVFCSVDLAAGMTLIESVKRCGASFAAGRPICYPDNNGGESHKNDQRDDQAHATSDFAYLQSPINALT
jgi:hypothetical protein